MRRHRVAVKKGDISTLETSPLFAFRLLRQANRFAPGLQGGDRCPDMIINATTKPAKTGHRMRPLPRLIQGSGDLHTICWYQPSPSKRLT